MSMSNRLLPSSAPPVPACGVHEAVCAASGPPVVACGHVGVRGSQRLAIGARRKCGLGLASLVLSAGSEKIFFR